MVTKQTERPDTRNEIMRAAERLFAERGIDGVSLREINRLAGQGNASALQYHFESRNGLLHAIIEKHRADTEPRRHMLLDQYEADGSNDIHLLSGALVLPLAAKLSDPDGGRDYLQINCEIFTRQSSYAELVPKKDPKSSIRRWHELANPALPEEEGVLHWRFPALRFAFVELARRASEPERRDDRLFTSHLTDLVAALLGAQPSEQTRRLMQQRRRQR